MDLAPGRILDRRWTLRRLVARDDHGTLYEVKHVHLDRIASLVVAPKAHRVRLLREARLRDGVDHEGVLRILDVADADDGGSYVVTGYLAGRPLDGVLLARGTIPPDDAVAITLSLADALAHVHELGLAHEALSPSSVLLNERKALLADLGVYPTPLGSVTGSLASMPYTAPERLREGRAPSPVADVYSVCAILAEMLTGAPPRDWPPTDAPFGMKIASVIDVGLGEVSRRFPTAGAFAAALREATSLEPLPPSVRPAPRRKYPRAAYVSPVRVRLPAGTALDGRSEEISEGGMFVLAAGRVTLGDAVLLRFSLPSSGRVVSEPGTVRWVRGHDGDKIAFGIELDGPGERTVEDIRKYVGIVGGDLE